MQTSLHPENRSQSTRNGSQTEVRPRTWLNLFEAVLLSAAVSMAVFLLQWRYGFNYSSQVKGYFWFRSVSAPYWLTVLLLGILPAYASARMLLQWRRSRRECRA